MKYKELYVIQYISAFEANKNWGENDWKDDVSVFDSLEDAITIAVRMSNVNPNIRIVRRTIKDKVMTLKDREHQPAN